MIASLILLFLPPALASEPPKPTPELLSKGKQAFVTNCASCHGEKGDGNGPAGKYLVPRPRNFATGKFKNGDSVSQIFGTITHGLPGTPMASFASLPEEDRWAIAYYVQSFRKKK